MGPERFPWDDFVPFVISDAVWQVTKDHVDAAVRDLGHEFDTIAAVDDVGF